MAQISVEDDLLLGVVGARSSLLASAGATTEALQVTASSSVRGVEGLYFLLGRFGCL